MTGFKKQMMKRILSAILAILMVITSLPVDMHAATGSYADVFTFTVTDGANPIQGATVHIYDGASLDYSKITDANGEVEFPEFTVLETKGGDVTCNYEVSASGYDNASGTISNTVEGWDGNREVILTAAATMTPVNRNDFKFAVENNVIVDLDAQGVATYTNVADCPAGQDNAPVTYSSSNPNVASVNDAGEVTFSQAGTVTITATMPANGNYTESTASYTITARGARIGFDFVTTTTEIDFVLGGTTYKQEVSAQNDGATISYSIISQKRDGVEVGTGVADIDPGTGEVTIHTPGVIVVEASAIGGTTYLDATAEYTLTIKKLNRTGFEFAIEQQNITPVDLVNGTATFTNTANCTPDQDNATVTYASSDDTIATVDHAGNVTFSQAGTVTITATMPENGNYGESTASYMITARGARTGFDFVVPATEIDFVLGGTTYKQEVSAQNDGATIIYSITSQKRDGVEVGTGVANINPSTGEVTIHTPGVIVVEASATGGANYQDATAEYTLTINKLDRTGFEFDNTATNTLEFANGLTFTKVAGCQTEPGTVSYRSSDTNIATVDVNGVVTFVNPGTVTIYASMAATTTYNASEEISYVISAKAYRTGFEFARPDDITTYGNAYAQTIVATENDGALISYEIIDQQRDGASVLDVATINQTNGEVTIHTAGTIRVKATVAESTTYFGAEATYDLEIIKAEQTIGFAQSPYLVNYGTAQQKVEAVLTSSGGSGAPIIYSITSGVEIGTIDSTTGDITFVSGKTGTMVITAQKAGDACYDDAAPATCEVVVYKAALPTNVAPTLEETNKVAGTDWYTDKVIISAPSGYKVSLSDVFDDATWSDLLEFTESGSGIEQSVYLKEDATNVISDVILVGPYNLDNEEPEIISVTYEEANPIEIVLARTDLGYFQNGVAITVKAYDEHSGINRISYNMGDGEIIKSGEDLQTDAGIVSARFIVQAPFDFDGDIEFKAYDNVGISVTKTENKHIIVENTPPDITIDFGGNTPNLGKYYSGAQTATITIIEKYFDQEDVVINILKKGFGEADFADISVSKSFTNIGADTWQMTYPFTEAGTYQMSVSYMDKSGNSDTETVSEFVIDTAAPVIEVTYADRGNNTGDYTEARTATFKITEQNFRATEVVVTVEAKNYLDQPIPLEKDYANLLNKQDVWSTNGEIHEATVVFDQDAYYTINVGYSDLSGQGNNSETQEFRVDMTAPTDLKISYSDTDSEGNQSVWKDLISKLFGFYKNDVTVTLEATDDVSKIIQFAYEYTVSSDAGSSAVGGSGSIASDSMEFSTSADGKTAIATFTIPAQFRGNVSFTVWNDLVLGAEFEDEKVVVTDTIAPGVEVTYQYANSNEAFVFTNDDYSNKPVKALISIEEDNFFGAVDMWDGQEAHLIISRGYKTGVQTDYTYETMTPEFTYVKNDGEADGKYIAEVSFLQEGDYAFGIEYTDRSGNVYKYNDGQFNTFTIDETAPIVRIDGNDGQCYGEERIATIEIEEHNFTADTVEFSIRSAKTLADNENNILLNGKDIATASEVYKEYLQTASSWVQDTENPDIYRAQITFDAEAIYEIQVEYTDLAGNSLEEACTQSFTIDKSKPVEPPVNPETSEVEYITYSQSILDRIFETITFGFYKAPVTVTITAVDNFSGIDHFVYSYKPADGTIGENNGADSVEIPNTNITQDGNKFSSSFQIPAQFRGMVSFVAVDRVGYSETFSDITTTVVVDDKAPVVNVTYTGESFNGSYYNANRIATITITEANFFGTAEWGYADLEEEYLVIKVGKRLDGASDYTYEQMKPVFTYDAANGYYVATIEFNENADYTFDIQYKDRSLNEATYNDYERQFTIDKVPAKLSCSYDNNDVRNNNYYNADRVVTFTIEEHNFDANGVLLDISAKNAQGVDIDLSGKGYMEHLTNQESWMQDATNPNIYRASIVLDENAKYTYELKCTDLANNPAENTIWDSFYIDKTAPTHLQFELTTSEGVVENINGEAATIAFNKFYNQTVAVRISANCDVSGLHAIQYQKVDSPQAVREDGWLVYDANTGIVIEPNERCIIYAKVIDKAGNFAIGHSTGFVVDNQLPIGETRAPEIDITLEEANGKGYYTENVTVQFAVKDPGYVGNTSTEQTDQNGYYSGLNKVLYRVYTTDTGVTESGVLFDYGQIAEDGSIIQAPGAIYDTENLAKTWAGSIEINAAQFDSNKVIVEVTAIDNAGNTRISATNEEDIKIDVTAPQIKVDMSNSEVDSSNIFKADRVATISIKERNFDSSAVNLMITNTDGNVPGASGWSCSGEGNDATWSTTVLFEADGDYEFSISYSDMAGNANDPVTYEGVTPNSFTIDKTVPEVEVTYDNNASENGNYYGEERTATIRVTEHNFTSERINVIATANNDGAAVSTPSISGWSSNGDVHTATIRYGQDALYTFDIEVQDMAGNDAEDFAEEEFYVDLTAPELTIEGIEKFANNGEIAPVVTYSDTNFDNSGVSIVLEGKNRGRVALEGNGTYANTSNGQIFTFNNFPETQDVDDIYTLTVTITDKAGHETTESQMFSVNRFGSTYDLDKVKDMNGKYVQQEKDVVITEVNVNALENIKITLFKNNQTIVLEKDVHYSIDVAGSDEQGYSYTYTIFAENFADEGVYRIAIHSEDAAGNVAENTLDVKDKEIGFGIDKNPPNVNVTNLESNTTYVLDSLSVIMLVNDNLLLDSVTVYLDDYNTPFKSWNAEEVALILAEGGEFEFVIEGGSTKAHNVKIVCKDASGRESMIELTDIFVTTDLWVRYFNNKPLFYGSIVGGIGMIGLLALVVGRRRRTHQENA